MQPVRSRKDLLSPVMNEFTEGNNTQQLLPKKPPGLKVKLKQCLLLFSQLKNTHNLDHYTFFLPKCVYLPNNTRKNTHETNNSEWKMLLAIFMHLFVCTRKLTDTFQLVNKNCMCSYFMR